MSLYIRSNCALRLHPNLHRLFVFSVISDGCRGGSKESIAPPFEVSVLSFSFCFISSPHYRCYKEMKTLTQSNDSLTKRRNVDDKETKWNVDDKRRNVNFILHAEIHVRRCTLTRTSRQFALQQLALANRTAAAASGKGTRECEARDLECLCWSK